MATRRLWGQAVGDLADLLLKSHLQQKEQDRQDAILGQRQREGRQDTFASQLTQDVKSSPEAALRTLTAAKASPLAAGMNLDAMLPDLIARLQPVSLDIAKAKSPLELPDVVSRARAALTPQEFAPVLGSENVPASEDTLPSTQYAPTNAPAIERLVQQAQARKVALDDETQQKIADAGAMARAQAYGTGMGSGSATHENAPTVAADKADEITLTSTPLATAAGLRAHSEAMNQNAPDVVAAETAKAGSVAGAQADARLPTELRLIAERQKASETASDKNQQKLEQQYRTVLTRAMSNRSGTLGTEDAKVVQANHLLGMLDQFVDPKTGEWNIPRVQLNELSLGLAKLQAPGGQAGEQMMREFQQRTLKGDVAGGLTYLTGQPVASNTQAITKTLVDSIERQGQIAAENRGKALDYLRGQAPTDLAQERRDALERTGLTPLRQSRMIQGPNGQRKRQTSLDGGQTWK